MTYSTDCFTQQIWWVEICRVYSPVSRFFNTHDTAIELNRTRSRATMVGVVAVALIAVNTPNHRVFRSSHKTQKCGNRRWGCLRNRRRHPWSFHMLRCFADKWMHFSFFLFVCVCPQPHVDTLEPCRGCISTLPHFFCCLANTSCLATRGRQITNWSCPVAAGRVDGGQGGKHSLSSSPASAPGPERCRRAECSPR